MSDQHSLRSDLKGTPFFAEFTDVEMEEFLSITKPVEFRAADYIVRQGDEGDCMYCIALGKCQVLATRDGHHVVLATIGPGAIFGELAIFDHRPRSASVRALTECTLLRVDAAMMQSLAALFPAAAYKLMVGIVREIGDRLRKTSARYVDSLVAAPHLD